MTRWGNIASGILPFNRETCEVLLQLRSDEVNEGGTWGIVGGAVSIKESTTGSYHSNEIFATKDQVDEKFIIDSAISEFKEETGYFDNIEDVELFNLFKSKDGKFQYYSYLGMVDEKLYDIPTLYDDADKYWEAEDYEWINPEDLINKINKEGNFNYYFHPDFYNTLRKKEVQEKIINYYERCKKNK